MPYLLEQLAQNNLYDRYLHLVDFSSQYHICFEDKSCSTFTFLSSKSKSVSRCHRHSTHEGWIKLIVVFATLTSPTMDQIILSAKYFWTWPKKKSRKKGSDTIKFMFRFTSILQWEPCGSGLLWEDEAQEMEARHHWSSIIQLKQRKSTLLIRRLSTTKATLPKQNNTLFLCFIYQGKTQSIKKGWHTFDLLYLNQVLTSLNLPR